MIQLTVNGQTRKFDGDGDVPLLWYLRDELDLTGAKFGCGMGLCGACTVHQEGESGQIMQAAALLKKTPKPTDAQIDSAMDGNICRCGTYTRICAAIKTAAGVK
jgi:isoquinoline 1-oxidoreductase alpha subunit